MREEQNPLAGAHGMGVSDFAAIREGAGRPKSEGRRKRAKMSFSRWWSNTRSRRFGHAPAVSVRSAAATRGVAESVRHAGSGRTRARARMGCGFKS